MGTVKSSRPLGFAKVLFEPIPEYRRALHEMPRALEEQALASQLLRQGVADSLLAGRVPARGNQRRDRGVMQLLHRSGRAVARSYW